MLEMRVWLKKRKQYAAELMSVHYLGGFGSKESPVGVTAAYHNCSQPECAENLKFSEVVLEYCSPYKDINGRTICEGAIIRLKDRKFIVKLGEAVVEKFGENKSFKLYGFYVSPLGACDPHYMEFYSLPEIVDNHKAEIIGNLREGY